MDTSGNPWVQLRNGSIIRGSAIRLIVIEHSDGDESSVLALDGAGGRHTLTETAYAKEFILDLVEALSSAPDASIVMVTPAALNEKATIRVRVMRGATSEDGFPPPVALPATSSAPVPA